MYTTLAVVRMNHPKEGQYTILSVHQTPDEAQVEWNKHSEQDDVVIDLVDEKAKPGDVGKMTDDRPPRNYRDREDIEYDV
ncbi:MAG: hypothetical protein IID30_15235 [Planctomycetes bacterium]|nr:hypothetical protein [Planctomycetota bacterium]